MSTTALTGENTPKKTAKRSGLKPAWKPGQSGNPNGRPKGSRNKLCEKFVASLMSDFCKHGPATIIEARKDNPIAYLRMIADLVPKEFDLGDKTAAGLHGLFHAVRGGSFKLLPQEEDDE